MHFQADTLFANRYKLIRKLGSGGFSEVWLAEDTKSGNMQVALKIFATNNGLDADGLKEFSKEYSLVFNLNHPHLLKPMHYEDWNDMPYLVMQYMPKGSCSKRCGKMTEAELSEFLRQIGDALSYLHGQDPPIVHQDIKPDNVLIDAQGHCLLIDFGISTKIRKTLTKSIGNQSQSGGTTAYMAPERFSKKLNERASIKANDIFSLGVSLFELLTDELPYGEQGGIIAASGLEPAELPESFSPELRKLVAACLEKETWKRPTAVEMNDAALHFIKNGCWLLPERLLSASDTEKEEISKPDEKTRQNRPKGKINIAQVPQPKPEIPLKVKTKSKTAYILGSVAFIFLVILLIWQPWKSTSTDKTNGENAVALTNETNEVTELPEMTLATLSTNTPTNIQQTTAKADGNVTNDGGARVTERGICYSTSRNPTTSSSKASAGSGTGSFNANLTGLRTNTTYYICAYAINEKGTAYGEEKEFRTLTEILKATLSTNTPTNIQQTTATAGGNVTNDGGAPVTERGICYSTSRNPTTSSSKVSSGSGTGSFSANLTGLRENTTYYVRAYAVNEKGTSYGEERSFSTKAGTFTDSRNGKTYKTVRIGTQTWMAENINYSTGNSWCYDNSSSNCSKYGRLYDWNTALRACPNGWHLPSKSDFEALLGNVGGSGRNAYYALKEGGSSGFSALLGGWSHYNGTFHNIGKYGYWWSSSDYGDSRVWNLNIYSDLLSANVYHLYEELGLSVRCLHD
ncbi:MAG: FISUMP domain-containing protein [Bacteroidales bacterium]|nr:FISUMP domain-containing protein [Bacteroidales bacterium]